MLKFLTNVSRFFLATWKFAVQVHQMGNYEVILRQKVLKLLNIIAVSLLAVNEHKNKLV